MRNATPSRNLPIVMTDAHCEMLSSRFLDKKLFGLLAMRSLQSLQYAKLLFARGGLAASSMMISNGRPRGV